MSKFFKTTFSFTEKVETEAVIEGDSPDEVADKIRNYFSGKVEDLVIHSIEELELQEQETPEPKKPNLRLVN